MNVWALTLLLLQVASSASALAVQALQPAPPQTATDQPKATLRGHVHALDNGAPLKRAQVTLRGTQRQSDPQGAMTDAQGAFEFRNVEPGTYYLSSSKAGFIGASYGQNSQRGTPLTVRPGQELKDLDMRLMRGGVISGVITDEDGEPLSNVSVQTLVRIYRRGQSQVQPRGGASTDDRGQYRIFNLPPGRYFVQATQRGNVSFGGPDEAVGYAPIFYPNALTVQDAQRVEVLNGAEVPRIDMVLRSVPTYSVSGKVIDGATGKPVSEGFVTVSSAEMAMRGGGGGGQIKPDGSFKAIGVLPGKARIMVMGGGRGDRQQPFSRLIEVGSSNITDLQIVITPGVTVRGKIVADGGTPPANARVFLNAKDGGFGVPGGGGGNGTVNKDLTFEFPNVQPGDYEITVASGGGGPFNAGGGSAGSYYVREIRKGSDNVLDRGLTVDAPISDLEVVLDFSPGSVIGKATDENGDPLAGAMVVLISADLKKRASDRYFRTGSVDQTGNYKVSGVIPGDYLAVLWPGADPYQVQDPDVFGPLEKHATRVTVEKAATANQDLRIVTEIKAAAQSAGQ